MGEIWGFLAPSQEAAKIFAPTVLGFGGGFFYAYRTRLTREALRRYGR